VPVYYPPPPRDEATGLFQYDPGCVNLDPEQALAYARSRHFEIRKEGTTRWVEDPTSDIGRITRQQEFIKAALRKAVAKGVRNPFVLKDLIGVAQENVTLDTELSIQDLVDLGLQFKDFDPDDLVTYAPSTRGTMVGAMSVLLLNDAASQPTFDVFRGIAPIPGGESIPPLDLPATTSSVAPGASTTSPPVTTAPTTTSTTINEFIPRVPDGETCG
jgi:hypothetical protein